jgi:hypothetical protein
MDTFVLVRPTPQAITFGTQDKLGFYIRGEYESTEPGSTFFEGALDEPDTQVTIVAVLPDELQSKTRAFDAFCVALGQSDAAVEYLAALVSFVQGCAEQPILIN